jgi:CheY-like chemotaxis protein
LSNDANRRRRALGRPFAGAPSGRERAARRDAFRADPETRKVKIIMCTGTPEVTLREVADYHGFLTKPVALTDLMRSLDLAFKTH